MSKRIIPYGNRILCRRRRIGEKIGSGIIVAAQETADRPTDIADVVYVPEHSFADKALVENAEKIIAGLTDKAMNGSHEAVNALLSFNFFLKIKNIRPGDVVFISKYVGTDFHDNEGGGPLCMLNVEDIIGVVKEQK